MFKFLDIFKTENQKTSDALRASLPILARQARCVNGNKSFTEVTSLLCNGTDYRKLYEATMSELLASQKAKNDISLELKGIYKTNAMLSDTVEFQSEKIQLLNNECGTQRQACRAFENACEMNNEVINVLLKRVSDLEDFVLHQNLKTN